MARLSSAQTKQRLALYHCGMGDTAIARREGVDRTAIRCWRITAGLPQNGKSGTKPLRQDEHVKRLNMHRLGWSDERIARACGIKRTAIHKWRTKHNLKANFAYGSHEFTICVASGDEDRRVELYRRGLRDCEISREIGLSFGAITQWRASRGLPRNEPTQAWQRPSTSFVSLDAERGEGGLNLHGLIADDAAAEWLEENGATVW